MSIFLTGGGERSHLTPLTPLVWLRYREEKEEKILLLKYCT